MKPSAVDTLRHLRVQALEEEGWTFTELPEGWIAELGEHRGVFDVTLDDLLRRLGRRSWRGRVDTTRLES